VALTAEDPPGETTHWTSPSLLAGLLFGTPTATA